MAAGAGCARGILMQLALAAALLGLASAAHAQAPPADPGDNHDAWGKFMRAIGMQKPPDADTDINYTERAPLVVPPSRDLPPPAATGVVLGADWPKDPPKAKKGSKDKPAVVPGTAVQTPNPPHEKKPWYNPAGWFDKEEYANFSGEPVRENLTDPPAGYRIPSADQPYGINPDKKKGGPTSVAGTQLTGAPSANTPAAGTPAAGIPAAGANPAPAAPAPGH
jgi:hypothetical protein